jgi:hypothetical protein
MKAETGMASAAAPCVASARATSRSENTPTTTLPSVRHTSLTTRAPMISLVISATAVATVSPTRIMTTRESFWRRMSSALIGWVPPLERRLFPAARTRVQAGTSAGACFASAATDRL